MKKILSLLLAAVLVITSLSCATVAFAEDEIDYSVYTLEDVEDVEFRTSSDMVLQDDYMAALLATVTFSDGEAATLSASFPFSEDGGFDSLNDFRDEFMEVWDIDSEILYGEEGFANVRRVTCTYGEFSDEFEISNIDVEFSAVTPDYVNVPIQFLGSDRFIDTVCANINVVVSGYEDGEYGEYFNAPFSDLIWTVAGEGIEFNGYYMGYRTLAGDTVSQYGFEVPDESQFNILFNLNSGEDPLDPSDVEIGDTFPISVTWENTEAELEVQIIDVTDIYDPIALNEVKNVTVDSGEESVFLFTPEESGIYMFYSTGEIDTYGEIYDFEDGRIKDDDDNGDGNNFRAVVFLEEGRTFMLISRLYSEEDTGSYSVTVEKSPIVGVEYTPVSPITIAENTSGEYVTERNETFWVYNTPAFTEGDTIEVTDDEGNTVVYTYIGYDDERDCDCFVADNGDYIDTNELHPYTNQGPEFHWEMGADDMRFIITYMGIESYATVTIIDNPYESIVFTPAGDIVFTEGMNCYTEHDYDTDEDFFAYKVEQALFVDGSYITVTYKDESLDSVVYYFDSDRSYYFDEEDNRFPGNISEDDNQYEEHWAVGGPYEFTVYCDGAPTVLTATVAASPIESIEFTRENAYTIVENTNGWESRDNNDNPFWAYNTPGFTQGDVLTINYSDESSVDYTFGGYDENRRCDIFVAANGDVITEFDLTRETDQWDNPWGVGTNYMTVGYGGKTCRVPVEIVEDPISLIEFVQEAPIQIQENTNGQYKTTENGETYFEYDVKPAPEGSYIHIVYNDGTEEYYYGNGYWNFYDEQGGEIPYNISWGEDETQADVHWTLGNTYTFILYLNDENHNTVARLNGQVEIVESLYLSIQYIPANDMVFYENADGEYETDYNDQVFYRYDINRKIRQLGDQIVVNYATGETVVYTYTSDSWNFVNDEGEVFFGSVSLYDYQYSEHWYAGNTYTVTVMCADVPATFTASVVANPVASIVYSHTGEFTFLENSNGELEEDEDGSFWRYEIPYFFTDGDILTVNYNDGTFSAYYYQGYSSVYGTDIFENDNGDVIIANDVQRKHNQWENHWVIGGENQYIIVEYMGAQYNLPVEIVTNPVDSISFYHNGDITLLENTNGEYETNNNGTFWRYYTPYFYTTGDYLTVNYTDNTSSDYYYNGYSNDYNSDIFVNDNGDVISASDIARNDDQWNNPWVVGGDQYIIIEYAGAQYSLPVYIVENPVESIAYTPIEPVVYKELTNGWYEGDGDGRYWRYNQSVFNTGDILTVTYTDGTSDDYTFMWYNPDTDEYVNGFINASGDIIPRSEVRVNDEQYYHHWVVGGEYNYMSVVYSDREAIIPVTIVADSLQSIEFIPADDLEIYEKSFGYYDTTDNGTVFKYDLWKLFNREGNQVVFHYADNTSVTYTYEYNYDYAYWGFFDEDGNSPESYFDLTSDFPWSIGENTINITCGNKSTTATVTLLESNVKRIEYTYVIELIQGVTNYRYNPYTNQYEYTVDPYYPDAVLNVYYYDGSSKTFICGNDHVFRTNDGEELGGQLFFFSNQGTQPWDALGTYGFEVEFQGVRADASATIVENPVSALVYNGGNPLFIAESDVENNQDNIGRYFYTLGATLEVINNDGVSNKFTYRTLKDDYGWNYYQFTNENGEGMPYEDTFYYLYDTDEPFTYGEQNTLTFKYMNVTSTVPVYVYRENADCDESALVSALQRVYKLDLIGFTVNPYDYYSRDSLSRLKAVLLACTPLLGTNASQQELDAATAQLLTAISELEAYLNLRVEAHNGNVSVAYDDTLGAAGAYTTLFGTQITLTATPDEGFTFAGWYETVSGRIMSTDTQYSFKLTSNTNIRALFVANDSATLTFRNESGWIARTVTKSVEEWQTVSYLDDFLPDVPYEYGSANGFWNYDESEILELLQSGQDAEILPYYYDWNYTERPSIPTPDQEHGTPALTLAYSLDNDECVGTFIMAAGIPDNCEVESVGIAFYYQRATVFVPQAFELNLNNKMLTSKFNPSNESDYYIVDLKNMNSDYNWAARGYVTYYDANGKLLTAYSNQINIVDRQIAE